MKHTFILKPNFWIGEGNITLNMVEEDLSFYTKWQINDNELVGKIKAVQEIQIGGISENMRNELTFFDFREKDFSVEMENMNVGKVIGKGVLDDKLVAWEFRSKELNFEGFETYYLQEDGSYVMHAEYVTEDQFRTKIEGRIWIPSVKGAKKLFEDKE